MKRAAPALALLLLLLTVAPSPHAAGFRRYGGEAVVAMLEVPRSADPVRVNTAVERMLTTLVHAPLFAADERGPRPLLLDGYTPPADGRHYVLTIDPRARFGDGTPVSSADVADSLQRLAASEAGWLLSPLQGWSEFNAGRADTISGVERLDDRRVLLRTSSTFHGLADLLTAPEAAITQRGGEPDAFWGPPGAGPFRPGKSRAGDVAVLEPSRYFVGGRPFVDRLVFRRAPDEPTARGWLSQGRAQAMMSAHAGPTPETATVVLLLNEAVPSDERARAVQSVDRKVLSDVFLRGRGQAASRLLPPRIAATNQEPSPPQRPGPSSAQRRTLWVPDTPDDLSTVAERLAVDLLGAGILVERRTASPQQIRERAARGDFDLLLLEWRPTSLEPAMAMWEWSACPALKTTAGSLAATLASLPATADADARDAAAAKAESALLATHRVLPLYHPTRRVTGVDALHGLKSDARGVPAWADVWLTASPEGTR